MKKNSLIVLVLYSTSIWCTESPKHSPLNVEIQPPQVTVKIKLNNNNALDAETRTAVSSNTKVSNKTSTTLFNAIPSPTQLKETAQSLKHYFIANKFKVLAISIISSYAYAWYTLLHGVYKTNEKQAWCQWKPELSLDELLQVSQKDLAKDLLLDIQKKYASPKNLQDFFTPLIQFINDTDQEKKYLEKIQWLSTWIETLHMDKIFPRHQYLAKKTKDKIHRLSFLKNILLTWLSEYKISLNTQKRAYKQIKHLEIMLS